jgi:hypothetical protein
LSLIARMVSVVTTLVRFPQTRETAAIASYRRSTANSFAASAAMDLRITSSAA